MRSASPLGGHRMLKAGLKKRIAGFNPTRSVVSKLIKID